MSLVWQSVFSMQPRNIEKSQFQDWSPGEIQDAAACGRRRRPEFSAAAPLAGCREAGPGMAIAARRGRCPSAHTGADEVGTLPLLTQHRTGGNAATSSVTASRGIGRDSFPSRGSHETCAPAVSSRGSLGCVTKDSVLILYYSVRSPPL